MAINKKLIHFKTFSNFNSKKLSANGANTQYTLGVNGTVTTGDPEILYQSVCWIKDTKQQWTHGQLYDLGGGASGEENVQSDWLENSSTDAYIKNRTHYVTGTKITSAGTYTVTSPVIYYNKNLYTLEVGVKTTLQAGPPIYATLLSSTSIKIEDSSGYLAGAPLFINAVVSKLSDIYISDNIVRSDNLSIVATSGSYEDLTDKPVYITDFDVLSLHVLATNPNDGIQADKQAIIDALAANKIVLVPYEISDNVAYRGYATLVGYTEDLLYFKVITDIDEIIVETSLNQNDIYGQEVTLREWSDKQDKLISGTNIKTINGQSLLGSGNLVIEDGTYIWNWDGSESGSITQDQWDALQRADSILVNIDEEKYIPQQINKTESEISVRLVNTLVESFNFVNIRINSNLSYECLFHNATFIKSGGLKTINGQSLEGSGDITIEVQDTVTESVVSGWGFTKNAGTITEIKANGTSITASGVANIPAASTSAYGVTKLSSSTSSTSTTLAATASAVKAAYDLANGKQDKLTSGTNIMTARGQSILTSGDLFDPVIISTNAAGTSQQTTVGKCYVYTVPQTTAKTFVLNVPNNIWNDSINIIIKTSESITFQSSNALPILWANGTTPTFDSDKVYEISFRYTPMGWLGVAVAFHSA